jgi:hypothetical protein
MSETKPVHTRVYFIIKDIAQFITPAALIALLTFGRQITKWVDDVENAIKSNNEAHAIFIQRFDANDADHKEFQKAVALFMAREDAKRNSR